jgi:hypothetical protein
MTTSNLRKRLLAVKKCCSFVIQKTQLHQLFLKLFQVFKITFWKKLERTIHLTLQIEKKLTKEHLSDQLLPLLNRKNPKQKP